MSVGLYAPGLDIIHGGFAQQIRMFDRGLTVVFNKRIGRFEIYDTNAPGGPKWQMVMRVQNEDGSFRPLDSRALEALRQSRGRTVSDLLDEFDRNAERREAEEARIRGNLAAAMADDMKYAGRHITQTVESRNRTREAIRAVAS